MFATGTRPLDSMGRSIVLEYGRPVMCGEVLVNGRRYPFAGAITMDQVVIDIGDDPVSVGDEVVFLGRQGTEEITAEEWADRLDTINYEIVCHFGPRLPRVYTGSSDGE